MGMKRKRLKSLMLLILVTIAVVPEVASLPEIIKIGGLFEKSEDQQEDFAFRYAINNINANPSVLPSSRLSAQVRIVSPQDSFHAYKAACDLLEAGIAAIVVPPSATSSGIVKSACDFFHIPAVQTHWDYKTKLNNFSVNLQPQPSVFASALLDFIKRHEWKSFALIYESNEALIRLQDLIKSPPRDQVKYKITLRLAGPQEDFKKLMKDLRISRENNFVVDLPLPRVKQLLIDARQVDMMTAYQNYFLTTLDIHTEEWTSRLDATPNITAFRLVDPQNVRHRISSKKLHERVVDKEAKIKQLIKTEAALLYDAVNLVAKSLEDLGYRQQPMELRSLFCDGSEQWHYGHFLIEHMKTVTLKGLSGDIKIDENGERTNFNLDIVKVKKGGIIKVGRWDPKQGAVSTETSRDQVEDIRGLFDGKTLRVTTIITPPYMVYKEPRERYSGNDRFEGYCVDLLNNISKELKFEYLITPVRDKKHGSMLPTGDWNGMVGELLRREADLAIGDLTITYDREEAVDFTMPFMNLGISILFKKPQAKIPSLLAFLDPLSVEVWFCMVTAFLGVSILMFFLARLSPYEWVKPQYPAPGNEVIENQFSLINIFWFVMGSIMQQGSDILPRAVSSRIVASSWWFFTLIMIKTYTANLAAFLTSLRMTSPITNAEDLAAQTEIAYGCVQGGSTQAFFRESSDNTFKRMWEYMDSAKPTVFTQSNNKGIERVMMGHYAFLMESTTIDYVTARNCELTKIGKQLDTKGYGIAVQPGSPYRSGLSTAILHLQESGDLHMLKEKWWKGDKCSTDADEGSAEMGMGNVGGVFLVLWIGMGIGLIIVIIEFVWNAKKQLDREPILKMLWKELKFILSFKGSSRPIPMDNAEPLAEESGTPSLGSRGDVT